MNHQATSIPRFLLLLLLSAEVTFAYVPYANRGAFSSQQSSLKSINSSYYGIRRKNQHVNVLSDTKGSNGKFGILASSVSNDDDQSEDFELTALDEGGSPLRSSSNDNKDNNGLGNSSIFQRMFDEIPFIHLFFPEGRRKLPPVQIDDFGVMLYDVFLIVNLSLSISFWVTHRMDLSFIPYAFNEGCLFSILWIASGLYHGSFLYSAMDGHYPLDDEEGRGGPKEAAALAFNTYINTINLRLIAALIGAWLQHRKVGEGSYMEELIPLEIGMGLVLMTFWRALHSQVTPRVR